jgi:hypothetical protein
MPVRSRIVAFLGGREALERKGDRLEERGREGDQEQEGERAQVKEDEALEQRTSHQEVLGAQVSP